MIYTITFNPSIDYFVSLDNLTVGQLNRSAVEFFKAGGKGINVSQVLTNLGLNNIALGFVGGFTGKKLVEQSFFPQTTGSSHSGRDNHWHPPDCVPLLPARCSHTVFPVFLLPAPSSLCPGSSYLSIFPSLGCWA